MKTKNLIVLLSLLMFTACDTQNEKDAKLGSAVKLRPDILAQLV